MKKKMKQFLQNLLLVTILFLTGVKTAHTQEINLERIVVTPSRVEEARGESARKVDIISAQDLKESHPKDIAEMLDYIPSVNIIDYGSAGAKKIITMRGSTEKQVLVLVDGRPINSPRSGDADLSTIPLGNINRIEVLHGPASSLYGTNAMGGVVNIITKQPPREGQKTELLSSFGTFRTYQEQMSHRARFKNLGYVINVGYQSSEGSRDDTKFNEKDASAKLTYEFNPQNRLIANGGFYKDKLGTPGPITSLDLDDKQLERKNFYDLSWEVKPWQDKDIGLSARTYQDYDHLEFIETPEPLDKTTHTTKSRGLNLKFNQGLTKEYRLIYGFDWLGNYNDSSATAKHKYIVRAGYLENHIDLKDKLKINLGARIDDYSNFGTEISPNLNILYQLKDDLDFHFLIARSFRAPTFNDLYWPATASSVGNPNLQPEKGISGEFGVEKSFSKFLKIGITYFRSSYSNLIKWQKDANGKYMPTNINSALIEGIEQEFIIEPFDNLNITISYTFQRARDEKAHQYLTYQPKNKGSLMIIYKGLAGFILGLQGQFVDRRFDNAANTISAKRYYVLGLKLSKDLTKNLNFFCNIDNLLNRKYQDVIGYPLPGFSITGGLKAEF